MSPEWLTIARGTNSRKSFAAGAAPFRPFCAMVRGSATKRAHHLRPGEKIVLWLIGHTSQCLRTRRCRSAALGFESRKFLDRRGKNRRRHGCGFSATVSEKTAGGG
jgi:hypothetical protein